MNKSKFCRLSCSEMEVTAKTGAFERNRNGMDRDKTQLCPGNLPPQPDQQAAKQSALLPLFLAQGRLTSCIVVISFF